LEGAEWGLELEVILEDDDAMKGAKECESCRVVFTEMLFDATSQWQLGQISKIAVKERPRLKFGLIKTMFLAVASGADYQCVW
jgi:hypothetical protein